MADGRTGEDADFGVGKVDGEHRLQLGLLVALRDALGAAQAAAEIDEILDRLTDFSKVHFVSEELLMRLYQYPDYEAHVADHERMVEELDALRRGGDGLTVEALDTLKTSLVGHIARADRTLHDYLARLSAASV
ncbi:MAG: bacteriohemerythrin [Rhodospirillales bacterium]